MRRCRVASPHGGQKGHPSAVSIKKERKKRTKKIDRRRYRIYTAGQLYTAAPSDSYANHSRTFLVESHNWFVLKCPAVNTLATIGRPSRGQEGVSLAVPHGQLAFRCEAAADESAHHHLQVVGCEW